MVQKITIGELQTYQKMGGILIDVRDPSEYSQGHLPNSYNIPYQILLQKIRNYPKDTILILYCSTGKRSRIASQLLVSIGYQRVFDLGKVSCE